MIESRDWGPLDLSFQGLALSETNPSGWISLLEHSVVRGTMDLQKLTLEPAPPFDLGVRDNFIRCRDEQNLRIPPGSGPNCWGSFL